MATRTKRRSKPSPLPQTHWLAPGGLLLAALIALVIGYGGIAAGLLLGAIGAWLVVMGRHRRWKGAPEAGYLLSGAGLLIIVLAIF